LALFNEVTKIKEDLAILEQESTTFTIPYAETDTFLEDILVPPPGTPPTLDPTTVPTTTTQRLKEPPFVPRRLPRINADTGIPTRTRSRVSFTTNPVTPSAENARRVIHAVSDANTVENYDVNDNTFCCKKYWMAVVQCIDAWKGVSRQDHCQHQNTRWVRPWS
jgi:hypothetical protein